MTCLYVFLIHTPDQKYFSLRSRGIWQLDIITHGMSAFILVLTMQSPNKECLRTCNALQGLASYQDPSWGFQSLGKVLKNIFYNSQKFTCFHFWYKTTSKTNCSEMEQNVSIKVDVIWLYKCLKLVSGISLPLTKELTSSQALAKENQKLDLASKTEAHNQ